MYQISNIFTKSKTVTKNTFWNLIFVEDESCWANFFLFGTHWLAGLPLGKAISSIKGSPGGHLGIYGGF